MDFVLTWPSEFRLRPIQHSCKKKGRRGVRDSPAELYFRLFQKRDELPYGGLDRQQRLGRFQLLCLLQRFLGHLFPPLSECPVRGLRCYMQTHRHCPLESVRKLISSGFFGLAPSRRHLQAQLGPSLLSNSTPGHFFQHWNPVSRPAPDPHIAGTFPASSAYPWV